MNELSKNLQCVLMRSGVQIWLEADRVENIKKVLTTTKESKFIDLDDEMINTADISGIFSAERMEEVIRRKNGEWKCHVNYWHKRHEECAHKIKKT